MLWRDLCSMQTTSFPFWRKACLDIWPDTKLAKLLGAHSVSNTHFIPANSMRMQIPAGRMLFHLAKALNAIWFSVITLFLVGRPHLLDIVLAMSTAEAELIALCACAANVAYCPAITPYRYPLR